MKKALQQLLLDRELDMAFQPIWDLQEDRVLGYEALARPPAHYGFSGPEQLFTVAHGSKMVHELDVLCFESIVLPTANGPFGCVRSSRGSQRGKLSGSVQTAQTAAGSPVIT